MFRMCAILHSQSCARVLNTVKNFGPVWYPVDKTELSHMRYIRFVVGPILGCEGEVSPAHTNAGIL